MPICFQNFIVPSCFLSLGLLVNEFWLGTCCSTGLRVYSFHFLLYVHLSVLQNGLFYCCMLKFTNSSCIWNALLSLSSGFFIVIAFNSRILICFFILVSVSYVIIGIVSMLPLIL